MSNQKLLVILTPADRRFRLEDHLTEIDEAIRFASCNLMARHHVALPYDAAEFLKPWSLIVPVFLPDGMKAEDFNVGRHLRGISKYLFKFNPELRKYRVGTRLFNYQVSILEEGNNDQ